LYLSVHRITGKFNSDVSSLDTFEDREMAESHSKDAHERIEEVLWTARERVLELIISEVAKKLS
jgi:hypothetical protein